MLWQRQSWDCAFWVWGRARGVGDAVVRRRAMRRERMTVWSSGIVEMVSSGDLGRRQLAFERSLIAVTYLSLFEWRIREE